MTDGLTVAEVLDRAADMIEPEGAWTQGASFRDAFGGVLDGDEPNVVSCCTVGAVNRVCGFDYDAAIPAYAFLDGFLGTRDTDIWNDAPERTQAEVVAKLREAAALAREQGK